LAYISAAESIGVYLQALLGNPPRKLPNSVKLHSD